MSKRILTVIISIMLLVIQFNVFAAVGDAGTYNGFEYIVITDTAAVITKYTKNETEVIVPERIGAYTVTKIGNAAFQDQKAVQKITLPETITEISDVNVFWYCTSLKSINLPKSLTYLATGAFTMCSSLEEIVIPDGITKLSKTFRGCTSLRKVVIPDSVTSIDRDTFLDKIGGTDLLKNVTIYCNEGSYAQQFASENGIVCVAEKQTTPFVIENREVTIKNNKPQIDIRLTNNCYDGICTAYAAVYEKIYSDDETSRLYDLAIATIDMEPGETKDIPTFVLSNDYKENLTYKIIILTNNLTPLLNAVERELVDKNADIDNYPKMNLFESNSSNSSWDKAIATENFGTTGWTNLAINDTLNYLPYEAYRSFPEIVNNTVTVDFDFSMNKYMDDTRFSVMNEENIIAGFITKDTHLYFEQSDGSLIQLAEYVPYVVSDEEAKTYVRAEIDLANGIVNYIRVDGIVVAEDISLTRKSNRVDGFDVLTGAKATGKLINRQIRINCDYIVNEDFNNQFGKLPNDWVYELNGSKTTAYEINSRIPDRFSVDVDTSAGNFKAVKRFDKLTGNPVFEIMTLQPEKRDGLKISLKNGNESVIEILADGEDFVLKTGEYEEKFYAYQGNVWYGLKAELDLINSKVSVFVNNKKFLTDVDLDIKDYIIDNIEITASENSANFIYDDVKLYMKRIIPDDYVPTPVKAEKEEPDFVLGMQVCNLWTEGQYNKTWDYIKSAPNRLPVFGPYDEGNPEMNDWEIKWLLEHGIDYELIWAYPNIKYSIDEVQNPIKPNVVREGHYIYDGFMNAEYSDMMKFAISFENDSANYSDNFYNEFFEIYVPYWIEYYFKDSRYLKIDDRPIMGIYVMDKFLNIFGTMGEDDDLINQGIAKFRQMCIDAGVGNPYIISHGFGYTEATFQKYSKYDIDCIGLATWPKHEGLTWQKSDIKNMAKMSDKYDMDFVTTVQPQLDLAAWELRTGFHSSEEEFSNLLTWAKDELPTLITQKSLSKSLLNFLTWNEYGEGHIMMPTQEDGFTYLDCVRDVFVADGEHTDIVPEDEQIKRINRMVDNERLVTSVRENPISRIPDDLSSLSVKKGWYFSSADDYADWKPEASAVMSHNNGKMIVEALSNEPIVLLDNIPEIDLYDVTYVKIRMKGNTTSCGGNIKWTTELDNTFDDIKRTYLETPISTASTMTDYYIPIGQSVKRTGRLTGLKLTPGLILDKTQKFEIESIELLSDDNISNGVKVIYGDKTVPTKNEPVYKNSTLMVPMREVVEITGSIVNWYAHNNSYIIYDKANMANACVFEIGASYATKGSSQYKLKEKPYCVSDKINDTVYVPYDLIEYALGVKIEWDSTEKTIIIKK